MNAQLRSFLRTAVLVGLSFALAGSFFAFTGTSFGTVLQVSLEGAVTGPGAITSSARWMIPLLLMALGATFSFRAGYFNVGAQGQMYAGAVAALAVALSLTGSSALVVVPLTLLSAVLAGAIWSLVPGVLRIRFGTDEVVTTLMMNFIGALLLQYVTAGPLKDPSGSGQQTSSIPIDPSFRLSTSTGVSTILVTVVVIVVVVMWVTVYRTPVGLQATLIGRNPLMALWQGVEVQRVGLVAFGVAGGLAGLAGGLELLGPAGRLASGFSPNLGFTAIVVALVGVLSVPAVVAAAAFFGGMESAILYLPIVTGVPRSALTILQGTIAFLITVTWMPRIRRSRAAVALSVPDEPAAPEPEEVLR